MGIRERLHDRFDCPYGGQDWHNQIWSLKDSLLREPKEPDAVAMRSELDGLVHAHLPRQVWGRAMALRMKDWPAE